MGSSRCRFFKRASPPTARQQGEPQPPGQSTRPADQGEKQILGEEDAYEALGFSFPQWKKWAILTSIFICQLSMNYNAAIYSTAISGLSERFGISDRQAEFGQMIFLVCYAFGCEAWAPWSEELGRRWLMQSSLFLVNVSQIACALAPNFGMIMGFRAFGGLSSAGGSVTLGMVADLFEADNQQHAVNYVVLSSVMGSVIAPIAGGFIRQYVPWQWAFWTSLIFGGFAQVIHFCVVPETRATILLDRHAKSLRDSGENPNAYGPNEARGSFWKRISLKEIVTLMWRPYSFLYREPIVAFLSLLSGFSDALIFTGLDSFAMVMAQWNFSVIEIGLSFIPLAIGYLFNYFAFMVYYHINKKIEARRNAEGKPNPPERRLWLLQWIVLLEPIGLFIYGWTSLGPDYSNWSGPLCAALLIATANAAIYLATVDYMIAAYGAFSSSATGGNGFCRDFLAGIAALYARPMFENIKPKTKWQLPIPSFILCGISIGLVVPVFIFYRFGEWFRKRSPFAESLAHERDEKRDKREHAIAESHLASTDPSRQVSRAPTVNVDVETAPKLSGLGQLKKNDKVEIEEKSNTSEEQLDS